MRLNFRIHELNMYSLKDGMKKYLGKKWKNLVTYLIFMKELLRIIPQKGKVEWIGIRSKKKEELSVVESVKVETTPSPSML